MKVIPKVGQVWEHIDVGRSIVTEVSNGVVLWSDGATSAIESLYKHDWYTFTPQNDLEWLAVNCDRFHKTKTVVEKVGEHAGFSDTTSGGREYTRQQWQDKRNELFGGKPVNKMKVELVKCGFESFHDAYTTISNTKDYYSIGEGDAIEFSSSYPAFDSDACAKDLMEHYKDLYRKVETPVTWKDEVVDLYDANLHPGVIGLMVEILTNDCGWSKEALKFCHSVASLTDNPNE